MSRVFLVAGVALLIVPSSLFAQDDALRAQIRTDLQSDPRAASMSEVELESLITLIAEQATEEGKAEDYLESQNTFDYSALFAASDEVATTTIPPIVVALAALGLVLMVLVIHMIRNREKHTEEPSDVAA